MPTDQSNDPTSKILIRLLVSPVKCFILFAHTQALSHQGSKGLISTLTPFEFNSGLGKK